MWTGALNSSATINSTAAFDDIARATSQCSVQYDAWSASSVSVSYSKNLASRSIKDFNPFTAPPVLTNYEPSCCMSLYNTIFNAVISAQDSLLQHTQLPLATRTHHLHNQVLVPSYVSCDQARTTTGSVWTWVDGYPRVNATVNPESCAGPSVVTSTYSSEEVSPVFPSLTGIAGASSAICGSGSFICQEYFGGTRSGQCAIMDEGRVELIYWPVSLSSSGTTTFTVTPTQTGLVTAEYEGTILTSPTVYLRYHTLYAGVDIAENYMDEMLSSHLNSRFISEVDSTIVTVTDSVDGDSLSPPCPTTIIGSTYSNVIIPVPPEVTLSTLNYFFSALDGQPLFGQGSAETRSFNYADLQPNPLPAARWRDYCGYDKLGYPLTGSNLEKKCATIDDVSNPYKYRIIPSLMLLRNWDATWENCTMMNNTGSGPCLQLGIRHAHCNQRPLWRCPL